jgi:hypothetical protein
MRAILLRISATFQTPFILYFKTFTFSRVAMQVCVYWQLCLVVLGEVLFEQNSGYVWTVTLVVVLPVNMSPHEAVMYDLLSSVVTRKVSELNSIIICPCVTLWRPSIAVEVALKLCVTEWNKKWRTNWPGTNLSFCDGRYDSSNFTTREYLIG